MWAMFDKLRRVGPSHRIRRHHLRWKQRWQPLRNRRSMREQKSAVEEELTIQPKPHRGKWGRRFIIGTAVLALLYLAWEYIWPLINWDDIGLASLAFG